MPRVNTIEIVINAKDKASDVLGSVGKNVQTVGKLALGGLGLLAGGAAAAGAGIAKLAIDAAPLESIEAAFTGLAESAGVGSTEMLNALKEGSKGMIAQRDLMTSFNEAAQLVSTDFAKMLPDAMGYLGKVSAATGQDLDFMLDSLVRGIGRLSPMILDNLGIQVDLVEANEAYAAEIGKTVDELTKQEQQAALMNQVMEKLAENTEAMPDITDTAAAGLAQMEATFKDLKDEAGKAFLPALNSVLSTFSKLAQVVLPIVSRFFETVLAPAVETITAAFGEFVDLLLTGEDPLDAIVQILSNFLPEEVVTTVQNFVAGVQSIIDTVTPYVEQAIAWIAQNVQLKDVLLALGIAIASVVVPALISVLAAVAPIVAAIAGLIAVVALLRNVWENDIGGIRTALTEFWENTAKPAFEDLVEWLGVAIPIAIETAKTFWEDTLKPALETVWQFITESVIPTLETIVLWLGENIPIAIAALADLWENTLKPALEIVWDFVENSLFPLFSALWELLDVAFSTALTALAGLWENVLKPALDTVWEFLDKNVNPTLEDLKAIFDSIAGAIETVIGWIKDLTEGLRNIKLPDWLTPGSPTPFELGLRGIASAMRELSTVDLPMFQASIGALAGAGSQSVTNNNYNMTVNTGAGASTVIQDFQTLEALANV